MKYLIFVNRNPDPWETSIKKDIENQSDDF